MEKNKEFLEAMNKLSDVMQEAAAKYEKECEDYWKNLPYEEQLKAFYSVCKRIHKGDIEDNGSYRYVLYDVFGFGMDAYSVGMECGYMDIHNRIYDEKHLDLELERRIAKLLRNKNSE